MTNICRYIKKKGIKLKINTCVSKLNYLEDFTQKISQYEYEVSQLKEIFLIYSNNDKYLTNKQYLQFLSDAQLLDEDIIYKFIDEMSSVNLEEEMMKVLKKD